MSERPRQARPVRAPTPSGVGLGLRFEILGEVLEALDAGAELGVAFFEVAPENYMRRGGFVPAALERIAGTKPLLSHGLTMSVGGLDPFDSAYMRELAGFLAKREVPFHSDHLCFGGAGGRLVHDLLPLPFTRESARHAAFRIREARERLGVPFAVENVTRYFVPGRRETDEASFFGEVLESSDALLLLDVNNAFVNAANEAGPSCEPAEALEAAWAFVERLPLGRVAALHVAGHDALEAEELLVDTHGSPVRPEVLELLGRVVERTGPLPVVLERDHRVPPLDVLLEEARAVASAYEAALARRARSAASGAGGRANHA